MKEAFVAWLICLILTGICAALANFGGLISDISWFVAVFSLMAIPILLVRCIRPRNEVDAGIVISWSLRDFLAGLIVLLALFIPVAFGNHFVRTEIQGLAFHFDWANYDQLSSPIWYLALIQIFAVALPEEFFFRGYFQTAMLAHFQTNSRFARFAPALAIVLTSCCFALIHLPSGDATRLLTFFPGLLFGTIRYKTGGLIGAILCHAGCNMMMTVMNVHYFV